MTSLPLSCDVIDNLDDGRRKSRLCDAGFEDFDDLLASPERYIGLVDVNRILALKRIDVKPVFK